MIGNRRSLAVLSLTWDAESACLPEPTLNELTVG
jgi:hypothetical protein